MKKLFLCFLIPFAGSVFITSSALAAIVVSNLDPSNSTFGTYAPVIGQAILTGNQPIVLSSIEFLQTAGEFPGETPAVYSRNSDGTVGESLFGAFTLTFDNSSTITTATANSAFTLQANTGYYFVLDSNSASNLNWSYTNSTNYTSSFGVTLPTDHTVFFRSGTTTYYYDLAQGPQAFQINGTAVVPEPSTWTVLGLGLVSISVALYRRRRVA